MGGGRYTRTDALKLLFWWVLIAAGGTRDKVVAADGGVYARCSNQEGRRTE
jgi:hypothetical protein